MHPFDRASKPSAINSPMVIARIFEVNHQLRTKPGFQELDIEAFIQKLKGLAPPVNPADLSSPKYIRFAIVAGGWYGSVEAKANIVRAVLSRELPVVGNVDGTVAGFAGVV